MCESVPNVELVSDSKYFEDLSCLWCECLSSIVAPHQELSVFLNSNPCLVTPWFSKPQACFWSKYKVIGVLAVDPAELVLFKVVNEEMFLILRVFLFW